MSEGTKTPYKKWQKAVLVGCLIIALLGTIGVIGALVKISGTIGDYGGSVGAPVYVAFIMGLMSVWLFAGSGVLLVHIAKTGSDIKDMVAGVQSAGQQKVV
jgi:hypothetical protein